MAELASRDGAPTAPFPDETSLRTRAVALAFEAVNGDAGRVRGDPVFEEVTEGRYWWPGYQGCGDLPHWVLNHLGFRDEQIMNRDDDHGVVPWRVGANLSRLVYRTKSAFVWATKGPRRPKPGDVLYVVPPEHVCVLESLDEANGTITVLEYGEWDAKKAKPAARRAVHAFRNRRGTLFVGTRVLRGWVDLAKLPGLIEQSTENRPAPTC